MTNHLSLIIIGLLFVFGIAVPLILASRRGGYGPIPGRGDLESSWARATVWDPRDLQR